MSLDVAAIRLIAISGEPSERVADAVEWARAVVRGGATMVQVRGKRGSSTLLLEILHAIVRAVPVPVIVNDRADVAILAGAAGVHLGPDDLPVERVRAFAPPGFVIGASVGSDAELAASRGADYVGVGPVFATPSKTDAGSPIGVEEAARLIRASGLPGVGIGGVTAANAREVIAAGAQGVAVLKALSESPEAAARALWSAIGM